MLGKLIKHEFKANFKLMLITHAFILLLSIAMGAAIFLRSASVDSGLNFTNGVLSIYVMLFFVAMAAISIFGTQVYVAIRFYKNLFTDEGYLMYTLPTTPTQLLHSKIITGALLIIFNLIVVGISAFFVYFSLFTQALGLGETLLELSTNLNTMDIISAFLFYALDFFAALLQIYGCICIGQLFHKNRLVAAIIAYLGTNFIKSITSFIINVTTNSMFTYSVATTTYNTSGDYTSSLNTATLPSVLLSLAFVIFFYGISHYIMNKKLNLM